MFLNFRILRFWGCLEICVVNAQIPEINWGMSLDVPGGGRPIPNASAAAAATSEKDSTVGPEVLALYRCIPRECVGHLASFAPI